MHWISRRKQRRTWSHSEHLQSQEAAQFDASGAIRRGLRSENGYTETNSHRYPARTTVVMQIQGSLVEHRSSLNTGCLSCPLLCGTSRNYGSSVHKPRLSDWSERESKHRDQLISDTGAQYPVAQSGLCCALVRACKDPIASDPALGVKFPAGS